jgi:hypothetical protein
VSVTDGVMAASQPFTWAITAPAGDTTPPTASIGTPTTGDDFLHDFVVNGPGRLCVR